MCVDIYSHALADTIPVSSLQNDGRLCVTTARIDISVMPRAHPRPERRVL